MDDTWLDLAIAAIKNSDATRARDLLVGYTRYHTKDERGWLWLSRVVQAPGEKIGCLQHVLQINPENRAAQEELDALLSRGRALTKQPVKIGAGSPIQSSPRASLATIRTSGSARTYPISSAPSKLIQGSLIWKWIRATLAWTILGIAALLFLIIAVAIIPIFSGGRTLVVLSSSMEPTIPMGAVAVTQPISSKDLQVGDVIAFTPNPEAPIPIIHRIVGIEMRNGTRYYTTRGDANKAADVAEFALPPTAWRVQYNIPLVGYVISYASSSVGVALLIVVPAVGLLGLGIWDGVKKVRGALAAPQRSIIQ